MDRKELVAVLGEIRAGEAYGSRYALALREATRLLEEDGVALTVTDEMVERFCGEYWPLWAVYTNDGRANVRKSVKMALTAALSGSDGPQSTDGKDRA